MHHSTFAISPTGMLLSATVSLTNLAIQDEEIMGLFFGKKKLWL